MFLLLLNVYIIWKFTLFNGCKYDVKVVLDVVRYIGKKCIIMKDFSVIPKIVNILGNEENQALYVN